jgi:hypothetical protein
MISPGYKIFSKYMIIPKILGIMVLLSLQFHVQAQQMPPRPISVSFNPAQGLRFGAFFQSISGGTVVISPGGVRTATGTIILADMGYAYGAANFEIVANPGTLISILNGPDVSLTGSNGGSITLHVGTSLPSSPFITSVSPPSYTSINVGGTLTIGSPIANPSGSYSGSFLITFFQE